VRTGVIPVLLYHSVSDCPPPDDRWGAVSRGRFATHLAAIAASGRMPISINELAGGLRGECPLPTRGLVVTFDDGYADTPAAVRQLLEHGISSTIYITSSLIDAPGRISTEQVTELAELPGIDIGAHAVHHCHLDELSGSAVDNETKLSKSQMEIVIGRRIDSFAYPHGAYDRRVRAAVVEAGYRSAAAVKNALSHREDDPFAIARWTVDETVTAGRLAEVLEGRHVPLAWSGERLRTRAYRVLRRQRQLVARVASC